MGIIGSGNSTCKDMDCAQTQGCLAWLEHRCVGGRSEGAGAGGEGLKREGVRGKGVGRGLKSRGFSECCPLEAETWLHTVLQRQRGSQPERRAVSHTVLGSLLWPGRPGDGQQHLPQ